jgi:ABC-type transport system involved in multi-copper enzyme maturation permease subunit
MRRVMAVCTITILETLSRKHVYVLLLILAGVYLSFGRLEFFDLGVQSGFAKLIPVTGIALFGVIVAVFASARQVGDEISQRTIYPLLAKPLSRFEFLIGKLFGIGIVMSVAIVALAAVFQVILESKGIDLNKVYWQAVTLQILQMWIMISLVLTLSVFLNKDATIVLGFLLYYLLGSAGATLEDMLYVGAFPSMLEPFYRALLFVTPRLDLFNISKAVLHDAVPQPWSIVIPFLAYAACSCTLLLAIGALVFRRKDL